jgi:hypothetical protein
VAVDIQGLVVVGCSKEKTVTSQPVPALDLYQGWCVPALRHRLASGSPSRTRVLVLSAHYGLVTADAPLLTYEQPMTPARARALREPVRQTLAEHLAAQSTSEALLLLAPDYLDVLGPLPLHVVHTITDPITHLGAVHRVLDSWSWPWP